MERRGTRNIKIYFYYIVAELLNLFIKPDPNFWLFSSSSNSCFDYNSKYLFEYILRKYPNIKCKFVINDDVKREKLRVEYGDHFIETKTLKGIRCTLMAGVWLPSAGLPIYLLFSGRKRIIFNLWHGTPLKRLFFKEKNMGTIQRALIKLFHSRNYTYITASSSQLINIYASNFGVKPYKIKVLGQPRNDLLCIERDRHKWLKRKYKQLLPYRKIILYAPTYRKFGETEIFPFSDFNPEILSGFLEREEIILFLRYHQYEANETMNYSGRIQYINQDKVEDINEVLNIFDLLVTDYSGIYLDYLLTLKPMLFLPYDLEEYSAKRGFNFDYHTHTPGPKPSTLKDFMFEVKKLFDDPEYYADERKRLNDYFNEVKGNSSRRIVQFIQQQQKETRKDALSKLAGDAQELDMGY
jgi:CDP-glycerol glycerophosphotransferase